MTDAEYQAKYGWFDVDDAHIGIKSAERVRKFAEVLTPRWMAEKMIDEVPGASEIESTVFEPCCGHAPLCAPLVYRLKAVCGKKCHPHGQGGGVCDLFRVKCLA